MASIAWFFLASWFQKGLRGIGFGTQAISVSRRSKDHPIIRSLDLIRMFTF
jgi:hypothetical protein